MRGGKAATYPKSFFQRIRGTLRIELDEAVAASLVALYRVEAEAAKREDLLLYHPDRHMMQGLRLESPDGFARLLTAHRALGAYVQNTSIPPIVVLAHLTTYQ